MVFQNPPAARNGIILAVVRGIIGQADVPPCLPHTVHQALHALGALAVIFWTVVEIADQRGDVGKPRPNGGPPLGEAIAEAAAGDFGEPPGEKDFIDARNQDAHGRTGRLRGKIVLTRDGGRTAFSAARERPACDHCFGIARNAQGICGSIRLMIDSGYAGKDRVRLWDFF
jgi:hypothetical protein